MKINSDEQTGESGAFQTAKRDKYEKNAKFIRMSFFFFLCFLSFHFFVIFLFKDNLHAKFEFLHTALIIFNSN